MVDLPRTAAGAPSPEGASAAELSALRRACELAARGAGTALPNPAVGCVLLTPDGATVGEGFHERAGGPHAEVVALAAAGDRAAGATAVVTLEPCNHTGRTGPCSEALIAAGVARVVVAVRDPWPTASGGIERLRAAGIDVVDLSASLVDAPMTAPAVDIEPIADSAAPAADGAHHDVPGDDAEPAGGPHATAEAAVALAEDVNRVWLTATRLSRPFVTLKMATSLDGRVAAPDGSSRWISGPESRADVHRLRARIDTILVGVGTVIADDPALTARVPSSPTIPRQPLRLVLDTHGRTPPGARLRDDAAPTLIATAAEYGTDGSGRVDIAAVLADLYRRGQRHVLVEGGPRVAAGFLDAGLVDEVLLYLAPLLLGAGRSAVEGGVLSTLAEARRLELAETRTLGGDLALRYRVLGGGLALRYRTSGAGRPV